MNDVVENKVTKTCRTCVHHNKESVFNTHNSVEVGGGLCESAKIRENDMHKMDGVYLPDALVYSYEEGGNFWTGDDFGCIHHEEIKHVTFVTDEPTLKYADGKLTVYDCDGKAHSDETPSPEKITIKEKLDELLWPVKEKESPFVKLYG